MGTALGARLVGRGDTVFGLRRSPVPRAEGIHPVAADLLVPTSLSAVPTDVDQVVYTVSAGGRTDDAYQRAYVKGLSHLLDYLGRHNVPVRRLVFVSSTAVYAQSDGSVVTEASPTEPTHFTGLRLLEGERLAQESPYPSIVLRLGGIYGPGRTSLLERVARGTARRPSGSTYTNRIHRDDCAGALAHLLALEAPEPVYLGVDREPADLGTVMDFLADALFVPRPSEEEAPPRESRRVRSHKRCASDRLVSSGYAFAFPTYREGYAPLLAQWKRAHAAPA